MSVWASPATCPVLRTSARLHAFTSSPVSLVRTMTLFGDMLWWSSFLRLEDPLAWIFIAVGLVVEFLVLWCPIGMRSDRALLADLVMNIPSTALGGIIPWKAMEDRGMLYGPREWVMVMVVAVVVDSVIEWSIVRLAFRVPAEKRPFRWLVLSHCISLTFLFVGILVTLATRGMK